MKNTLSLIVGLILIALLHSCSESQEPQVQIFLSSETAENYKSISGLVREIYFTEVDLEGNYESVNPLRELLEDEFVLDLKINNNSFKIAETSTKSGFYSGIRLSVGTFNLIRNDDMEVKVFSDENPTSQICCNNFELEEDKSYKIEIKYDFETLVEGAEFGIWQESNVELIISEI